MKNTEIILGSSLTPFVKENQTSDKRERKKKGGCQIFSFSY